MTVISLSSRLSPRSNEAFRSFFVFFYSPARCGRALSGAAPNESAAAAVGN